MMKGAFHCGDPWTCLEAASSRPTMRNDRPSTELNLSVQRHPDPILSGGQNTGGPWNRA
jgi:hypothetical protein